MDNVLINCKHEFVWHGFHPATANAKDRTRHLEKDEEQCNTVSSRSHALAGRVSRGQSRGCYKHRLQLARHVMGRSNATAALLPQRVNLMVLTLLVINQRTFTGYSCNACSSAIRSIQPAQHRWVCDSAFERNQLQGLWRRKTGVLHRTPSPGAVTRL